MLDIIRLLRTIQSIFENWFRGYKTYIQMIGHKL